VGESGTVTEPVEIGEVAAGQHGEDRTQ